MQLHVAQGRKAIEPGVGHGLDRLLKAFPLHALDQVFTLGKYLARPTATVDQGDISLVGGRHDLQLAIAARQTEQVGACGHGSDEVLARLWGVTFQLVLVHGVALLLDTRTVAGTDGTQQFGFQLVDVGLDLGFGFEVDGLGKLRGMDHLGGTRWLHGGRGRRAW